MQDVSKPENWKRHFFPFWVGQMLSILGSALVQFTLVWWLTRETGSATVLATASMFALLPEIVVQPFAGAIVDRLNRKVIIIVADAIIAAATLGLGFLFYLDKVEIWYLYGIMLLRGVGSAFHSPAEQASVALMVPEAHLARIAGLNQASRGIINITAAPLGALVLELLDVEGSLLIDVITAAIAIGIVAFTYIPKQQKLTQSGKNWFGMVLRDMRDGLRYLVSWKGLMVLTGMALVFKIALTPAFSLIPLLVYEHLHGNAAQYSLVEAVMGVGIVVGGLVLGVWSGFKRQIYTIGLGGFGVGAGLILLGVLPEGVFMWSLPIMFLIGFMIPLIDGPIMVILQGKIDNEYQGRVMTLFGSIINLSGPIGLAAAGPVSDALGVQIWFITAGVLIILCMIYGVLNKHVMNIDHGPAGAVEDLAG